MMADLWPVVSFTEVATLVRRPVVVNELEDYPEVGVRCFGKGIFHKPPRSGFEVGDKKLFHLKKNDFILQVTFAWEGAVGVISELDETYYGSVRVLTFEIDPALCLPEFLHLYFRTQSGVEQLLKISPGSAGRNRVLAIKRLPEVKVPLPPVEKQREVIERFGCIEANLGRISLLRHQKQSELSALLRSLIHSNDHKRAVPVPMSELVTWRPTDTAVSLAENYTFAGVKSFGRGVFRKEAKSGLDFAYDRLTQLRAGEFTFPKLMAWEGALGVVPDDCDGCYVSPEFPVFTPDTDKILPEILDIHFRSPNVWKELADISTGTNVRRRRLNPKAFLTYEFPVPPMSVQREVAAIAKKLGTANALADQIEVHDKALMPSLLDRIFNQHDTTGLGD